MTRYSDRDNALVSVVVPTHNSSRTLEACLLSIENQTHRPLEVIVVDNSSTDGTVDIARRHAQVVENCGPERSAQRNFGARLAKGEYLVFIDSDMRLSADVVAESLATLRQNEAPGVIIPEISVGEGFWAHCRALERSCYTGDDDIEAARFFQRAVFEVAGGFDENLTGPEDWDLTLRVAGGRQLPRTTSQIIHDEGRMRLSVALAKKRYYAASFWPYLRKHKARALRQANLILRPAFWSNWRRLARHPILSAGLIVMKTLETVAALSGVLLKPQPSPSARQRR